VKSIAVLPFRVLSSEKGDEYLSLGLADALITSLSQTRQVVVRQTEAVTKVRWHRERSTRSGREQNVEAVLDGQVQRMVSGVHVTARLVRTSDGASLWADHFDEQFTHIFAVEDAILRGSFDCDQNDGGQERRGQKRLTRRYTVTMKLTRLTSGPLFVEQANSRQPAESVAVLSTSDRLDPNYALPMLAWQTITRS